MAGLTETVRVMVRGPYERGESGESGESSHAAVEYDEMGEPVETWTPVDVTGCLVRVLYKNAGMDVIEPLRPDAAKLTAHVAMDSSKIDCSRLRGAKLRFPDRFSGDDLAKNELHVVGMPWPTPPSPLDWDILVEAEAQHG